MPLKSRQQRHEVILKHLKDGIGPTELARQYGIRRSAIYELLAPVLDDPYRRMVEAEEEAKFRREVWDLLS